MNKTEECQLSTSPFLYPLNFATDHFQKVHIVLDGHKKIIGQPNEVVPIAMCIRHQLKKLRFQVIKMGTRLVTKSRMEVK